MSSKKHPFEVRLKRNGKFFSRHFTTKTPEQAASRAQGLGRIMSVKKVQPEDIIGSIKAMGLQEIIGEPLTEITNDTILSNIGLSDIVFKKRERRQEPVRIKQEDFEHPKMRKKSRKRIKVDPIYDY